jgi:ferredoxin-NADP reductase
VDFVFTPSRRLTFAPGQYIECTLAHPHPDSRGNRRLFSIASSPTEETVRLGVRLYPRSSSYKTALFAMNAHTGMIGGQIAGDFTLPAEHTQKLVFIAGGVGITPFRSMLKYLVDTKQRRDIILIYAGKTSADLVYRDIVGEAQTRVGIKVVYTLTDSGAVPANWSGNRGRIDAEMIRQTVPDLLERIYYLSGPPDMVTSHRRVLRTLGIKREQIKTDYFYGLV